MSNPTFSPPTVTGYNSSPPPDDGTQVAGNIIKWSDVKTKLTDPVKTALETLVTTTDASFDSVRQYFSQYEAKATAFSVSATADDGKLYGVSGNTTVTLPAASTAGSTFRFGILKTDAVGTTVTITPNGSDNINGANSSVTIIARYALLTFISDGSQWFVTGGHGFPDGTAAAPGMFFTTDPDTGVTRTAANTMALVTGGATAISITSAGEVLQPLQSSFITRATSQQANATGAGTVATVTMGGETRDANGDFGSNTYTASQTGAHLLVLNTYASGLTAAMTRGLIQLDTSNRDYFGENNIGAVRSSTDQASMSVVAIADMDAADTAVSKITISNGAGDTADIEGAATDAYTFFCGQLIA